MTTNTAPEQAGGEVETVTTERGIPDTLDALKVPIEGLTPYGSNPRRGNVEVIVESLARHGQYRPIVVRAKTFEVLAGNHTLAAAKELGWTEIAATFVECTDDEAARIVLVDNRSADLGSYDDELLAELLSSLPDLDGTGYDDAALAALTDIEDPPPLDLEPVPRKPRPVTTGPGTAVLYHGDSLQVLPLLAENSVDAVVCDPPYGLEFMGREWDQFRVDGRAARWSGEKSGGAGSIDGSGAAFGSVSFFQRRTTSQCRTCGKRDAFRNPHPCDTAGTADWTTTYVDDTPMEARAFENWTRQWVTEALRVLKPGGYLIAFGATRTHHRLMTGIEDAGFDIRDMGVWLYRSGFPKSLNVSKAIDKAAGAEREVIGPGRWNHVKGSNAAQADVLIRPGGKHDETAPVTDEAAQWEGWGTALKPAIEPWVLARKPLSESTVAANVLRWGTGALNIDATRSEMTEEDREKFARGSAAWHEWATVTTSDGAKPADVYGTYGITDPSEADELGRWPANVVTDEPDDDLRFFRIADYPKASASEKPWAERGTDNQALVCLDCGHASYWRNADGCQACGSHNTEDRRGVGDALHPTVKPVALMRHLVRLVTPPGGTVLDPFAGTGTTGEAAVMEGLNAVLVEREADYLPWVKARLGIDPTPLPSEEPTP